MIGKTMQIEEILASLNHLGLTHLASGLSWDDHQMTSRRLLKRWVRGVRLMLMAAWSYELYRMVRRPHTDGALVAIWWREQL
jgi:hypothetical protein